MPPVEIADTLGLVQSQAIEALAGTFRVTLNGSTASSMTSGYAEKMLVADCGHVPHREREERVLDRVESFVSNVPNL